MIYQIPTRNLRTDPFPRESKNYLSNSILLENIELEIESRKEGPFEIELKYIDFEYDYDSEKSYQKYNLPIFLKI